MENIADNLYDAGMCRVFELNVNGTQWNPIGNSIEGKTYQGKLGSVVGLSSNGEALFVSSQLLVKAYSWFLNDWALINGTISVKQLKNLISSETGWRLTIGDFDGTTIHQFELKEEEKERF